MVAVARSFTYDSGNVNIDSAIYWYSKILRENKNHTTALNNLGVIYYEKNDTTRALEYYKKGGAAGNARSYDNLGDHYYIHKKFDRAIAYYHKAAEIGIPEYQVQLGRFYENGFLVKRDYQKAIYWYNEAARQYENDARYRLAWMYYAGLGVKKDIVKAKGLLQSAKAYSSDAAVFYDLIKD
jgi:TPR repeat protein